MLNLQTAFGTAVTGLVLLGCGASGEGAASGNTGAGATSGGSASAEDGGAASKGGASNSESGNAGTDASGRSSAGPQGGNAGTGGASASSATIGSLQVIRTLTATGSTVSSAKFDYVEQAAWDARASGKGCPTETYGACVLTKCTNDETQPDPTAPPSSDHLDAGTITMSADKGTFSGTGAPTEADHGYSFDSTGSISGQEIVTVSATGGTISAFSGKVQVPLTPLLLMPSIDGASGRVEVPVSRTADFTFSWDARGASQKLQLVVTGSTTATAANFLTCNLDVQAGTGTFKAGALSQLAAGTRIRIFGLNSVAIQTPQGPVAFLAAFEMSSADKMSSPVFVLQ
jgi:hypothetical protein